MAAGLDTKGVCTTSLPNRAKRRRLAFLALLLLVPALIGETLFFAPWADGADGVPAGPTPLPLAAVNPLGAHVFLEREVDQFKKQKTGEFLRAAGLGWIKQQFPWSEIEFRKGHFFDDKNNKPSWDKFDEIVDLAESNGQQIIARLDRTPDWARRPGDGDPNYGAPPEDPAHFGDFVRAFVTRYQGRIHVLQIWNEPNLAGEWDNRRAVNAAEYVALLKVAAEAARAVDPGILILSAPLATTDENWRETPDSTRNQRETVYLAEMYAAGAAPFFDVAAANAFGYNSPPEEPPDPGRFNFRRVELLRAVMEQHGDANKPVWFTEYAWDAPDAAVVKEESVRWGRVTTEQQAEYTVRGIEYARANWPWAGVFVVWYFRQVGDIAPDQAEYYFALVTPDFVPRPVYTALQDMATRLALAEAGTYGPWSAPAQVGPGWRLSLARPAEAGQPTRPLLVSQAATATLTLSFVGTDVSLSLAPATSAATRLYISVDGESSNVASSLPRDEVGRAYVTIAPGGGEAAANGGAQPTPHSALPQEVVVVTGLGSELPPGRHTLQLTTGGPGVSLAGFTVSGRRSYLAFAAVTCLLLALLGLAVGQLLRPAAPPPAAPQSK